MNPFYPHAAQMKAEMIGGSPRIFVPRAIHDRIYHMVDLSKQEVSWLGQVEQGRGLDFILGETHLFEQVVSYSETEMTTDDLARFGQQLLTEREDGEQVWNSIRLWGHFHPHGSTSPSPQDDNQMKVFLECGHPYFLRLIVTKTGRMEFTLYLIDKGLKIVDVPWEFLEPVDTSLRAGIAKQLKAKVKVKKYKKSKRYKGGGRQVFAPGSMAHQMQMSYIVDPEDFPHGAFEGDESEADDVRHSSVTGGHHSANVITTITPMVGIQRHVASKVFKDDDEGGGNGNGR